MPFRLAPLPSEVLLALCVLSAGNVGGREGEGVGGERRGAGGEPAVERAGVGLG